MNHEQSVRNALGAAIDRARAGRAARRRSAACGLDTTRRWGAIGAVLAVFCTAGSAAVQLASSAPAATRPSDAVARAAEPSLADALEAIRQEHAIPALACALLRGEAVDEIAAVGTRKQGGAERVTTDDLWHIGSCTKAMTATLCAMLVEDDKLRWDSTIGDVFPDLRDAIHEDVHGATLEHLLSHRAGIDDDLAQRGLLARMWQYEGPPRAQRIQLIRDALSRAPATKPGEKFAYSNVGYCVAAAMVERVADAPYEVMIRQRLFEPLGMASAGWGAPGSTDVVDQPWGHVKLKERLAMRPGPRADNPVVMNPAGRLHCSLSDWAKFARLHLSAARGEARLLRRETFERLHRAIAERAAEDDERVGYALGWAVARNQPLGPRWMHDGSNTMWYCTIVILPGRNLAVLTATNAGDESARAAVLDAARQAIDRARSTER